MSGGIQVEEVAGRVAFRNFVELPYLLHHGDRRWSAPVAAYERARLDPNRNAFFETGDGAYFLVRRLGVIAGRCTAHVAARGSAEGWFGFFDAIDDPAVVGALLDTVAAWLRDAGCATIEGPASFAPQEEPGVLVSGYDVAGTTGRPWHPAWYAARLEEWGLEQAPQSRYRTWRLATGGVPARSDLEPGGRVPEMAGAYADPGLALVGAAGEVAAVPDLTGTTGMALARRARRRDWEGCTVVRCDGEASVLIPSLVGVAGRAGYRWVVAPWSPDPGAPPETEHVRFGARL